jgi:phosphinothricin acetyltransferase
MSLRKTSSQDLERVVEIYNSSIEWRLSTADTSHVSVASKRNWFYGRADNRPVFVYEEFGHIYGWVSVDQYKDRPAYDKAAEVSIYIDHIYTGKGIGTRILTALMPMLPSLGVQTAIAIIFSHNERSLSLFGNFGFKQWGELPDVCEMDGENYSVAIMGCKTTSEGYQ